MKKLMFLFALCLAVATTAMAQTERGGIGNNPAFEKIKTMLADAGQALTADQAQKVLSIFNSEKESRREIMRDAGGDRTIAKDKMKALKAATAEKMQSVLSTEQFALVQKNRPQGGGRGGMNNGNKIDKPSKETRSKVTRPNEEGTGTVNASSDRVKKDMPNKPEMKDRVKKDRASQTAANDKVMKPEMKNNTKVDRPNRGKGNGKMANIKERKMEQFNKVKEALASAGVPLNTGQERKIKNISANEFQAVQDLKASTGDDQSAFRKGVKKLKKNYGKKMKAVLSSEQAKVVKSMRKKLRG